MIDIKEMNINEKRWEKYGQNKKYWRNIRKDFSAFQRQKNRSYPLLLNKEDIKKELEKIVKDPASYFYIDEDDGEIKGMCGYRISEQDKYLQTMLFFSLNNRKEFIKEVLDFLIEKYPSYTIIIGVEAQNRLIIDELIKHKFKLSDDLYSASAIP